jgi:hypothetical protein
VNAKSTSRILVMALTAIIFTITTTAHAQYTGVALYNFTYGTDGGSPHQIVSDGASGFYGVAGGGPVTTDCPFTCGVIFHLSKSGGRWRDNVIYSFKNGNDGIAPTGIALGPDGNLYGLTNGNFPTGNLGTAFQLKHTPTGWRFNLLHAFGTVDSDGIQPMGSPILDAAGNVWGVTYEGGSGTACTYGCGTVFRLTPTSSGPWTETIVHNFTSFPDGQNPQAGLTIDSNGNFFGTTGAGGLSAVNAGTIYELTPSVINGWDENVIYDFQGQTIDGASSKGQLLIDSSGNIFGTTYSGGLFHNNACFGYCGAVFRLSPNANAWTEHMLHGFSYTVDGGLPVAGLAMDAGGRLYGTTSIGPNNTSRGTVFRLTKGADDNWIDTVLYDFTTIGGDPQGGVVLDSAGNVYGSVTTGGTALGGVVYKLFPSPPVR